MVRRRKALGRKLRRDMAQNAMQFLAMIALCFLGTWVFAGLDANWRMEERTIEEWLTEGRLSDFWVTQSVISRQDVYRVRELEGVMLETDAAAEALADGRLVRLSEGRIRIPEDHWFVSDDIIASLI